MREMTNHVTFLMNVLFMVLNNATFIIQWLLLFQLKSDIGGYAFSDVIILWGLAASTFGLSHIFFNRVYELSELITNGKLDSFLVQPKNVLLSVISSGTSSSAIGDLIYGYLVICIFQFRLINLLLFTLLSILGAIVLTAFAVIAGSISFWIVRGDILASNLNSAVLHFSTYPDGIFKGIVRLILYTVVPVGFVNYLPLKVILHFNFGTFLIVLVATVLMVFLAFVIFYRGLKRYSSSNLMIARI
jgi:ABC-2 type transport system permease protein